MSELIDKKIALELLTKYKDDDLTSTEESIGADYCIEIIEQMDVSEIIDDDIISRKEALNAISSKIVGITKEGKALLDLCQFVIEQLPSIKIKESKVIKIDNSITDTENNRYYRTDYICSNCKNKVSSVDIYCSRCGKKLNWRLL